MSTIHLGYRKRFLSALTAIALAAGMTVATSTSSQATITADFFVGADTATAGDGGSCDTPDFVGATGVQAAINNANSGGTIYLCAGTFAVSTPITVNKNITITGSGMLDTILDGMGTTQILRVLDTTGTDWEPNSLGYVLNVSDMTLRNGSAVADRVDGAADECQSAPRCGGAIYIDLQASAHITRIFFSHNEAINGGAIGAEGDLTYHAYGSSFTVDKSYFSNNESQRDGGAISLLYSSGRESPLTYTPTKVTNSTFVNNSAGFTGQHINSNFAFMDVENSSFYTGADNGISDLFGDIQLKYSLAYREHNGAQNCQQNNRVQAEAGNYVSDTSCASNIAFADRTGEATANGTRTTMLVNPMPDNITTPTPIRFRLESPATGFLSTSCVSFGDDAWGTTRVRDNGTCEVGSWQRPADFLSAADISAVYTPGTISPSGHLNVEYTTGDTILNGGTYVANTAPKINGQTVSQYSISAPYTGSNYCDVASGEGLIYTGANYLNLDATFDCAITFSIPGNDVHDALDMVQHFTLAINQIDTDLTFAVSSISLPNEAAPITPTSLVHLKYGDSLAVASYSSGDNSTCTVDNSGVVTPVEAGSCVIYADVVSGAGGRELSKTYYLPITNSSPVTCDTTSTPSSSITSSDVLSDLTQVCDAEANFDYGFDSLSNPGVEYKGYLYFAGTSRRAGVELMRTDGKTTELVADATPGTTTRGQALNSRPYNLTVLNNTLYFVADSLPDSQGVTHQVLGYTDGVNTSSIPFVDGSANQITVNGKMVVLDGKIYFSGIDGSTGDSSLWTFDGTQFSQVTNPVTDDLKNPNGLIVFNGAIYFQAYHLDWSTDFYRYVPSDSPASALKSICSFATDCVGVHPDANSSTVWNGDLYLTSYDPNTNASGIVKLTRNNDHTDSVVNIDLGQLTYPTSLTSDDAGIYFLAQGPSESDPTISTGKEVYTYNGTSVSIVYDLVPNVANSVSESGLWTNALTQIGGKIFFSSQLSGNSDDTNLYVKDQTGHFVPALQLEDSSIGSSNFWIQGSLNGRFVVAGYSALDFGNTHMYYSGAPLAPKLESGIAPTIETGGSTQFSFYQYGSPFYRVGSGNGHIEFGPTNLNGTLSETTWEMTPPRTITASDGTWLHGAADSHSYQWYRCTATVVAGTVDVPSTCVSIIGATAATYAPVAEDVEKYLAVREGATNANGTGYSFSATTAVIDGPPMTLAGHNPYIQGTPWIGNTLTLDRGTWVGLDANALQVRWISCPTSFTGLYGNGPLDSGVANCRDITNQVVNDSFTVTEAEDGRHIFANIYATGRLGVEDKSTTYYTESVGAMVHRPVVLTASKLTGKQKVGEMLTAKTATWRYAPDITKKWYRCIAAPATVITAIPSGCTALTNTALTYKSVTADSGMYISYIESTTVNGTTFYAASPSVRVFATPTVKTQGVIRGTAKVSQTLTYTDSVWNGPAITKSRQWYACSANVKAKATAVPTSCKKIAGATGASLRLAAAQKAKFVTVFETVTNPVGTATSAAAATLAVKP